MEKFESPNSLITATPLNSMDVPRTQKETEKLFESPPNSVFLYFHIDGVTEVHRPKREAMS